MAKKPMTKAQTVSYFAKKFELSKKIASGIIDEVAALAVSETKYLSVNKYCFKQATHDKFRHGRDQIMGRV